MMDFDDEELKQRPDIDSSTLTLYVVKCELQPCPKILLRRD